MNIEKLKLKLEAVKDDGKSIQMSAYMRNLFPFLGVQKTPLRKVISEFVREDKSVLDWEIVKDLWDEEYREYQYVAMDYINVRKKLLTEADFEILYELIITKSWWDTADELSSYVGYLSDSTKISRAKVLEWSTDENMWIRRTAIICQRGLKEKTDPELLKSAILNNLGSDEFFINKGIGWALREYSKINKTWVADFIKNHRLQLSNLSIREGSKYI